MRAGQGEKMTGRERLRSDADGWHTILSSERMKIGFQSWNADLFIAPWFLGEICIRLVSACFFNHFIHLWWKEDNDAISCNGYVNRLAKWISPAWQTALAEAYLFWLCSERWLKLLLLTLQVLYATRAIWQEIPHCMTVQLRMTIAVGASVTLYSRPALVMLVSRDVHQGSCVRGKKKVLWSDDF